MPRPLSELKAVIKANNEKIEKLIKGREEFKRKYVKPVAAESLAVDKRIKQ